MSHGHRRSTEIDEVDEIRVEDRGVNEELVGRGGRMSDCPVELALTSLAGAQVRFRFEMEGFTPTENYQPRKGTTTPNLYARYMFDGDIRLDFRPQNWEHTTSVY